MKNIKTLKEAKEAFLEVVKIEETKNFLLENKECIAAIAIAGVLGLWATAIAGVGYFGYETYLGYVKKDTKEEDK